MEFDDLKVIWDKQNQSQLYAVNEKGLRNILAKQNRKFKRLVRLLDWEVYGSSLCFLVFVLVFVVAKLFGLVSANDSVTPGMTLMDFGLLVLAFCLFVSMPFKWFRWSRKQRERESKFGDSLFERIEKDISQAEFQIEIRKDNPKVLLPAYLGAFLVFFVSWRQEDFSNTDFLLLNIGLIAGFVFENWKERALVRKRFRPEKEKLEVLRTKLLNT